MDIKQEEKVPFFQELVKSLDYKDVLREITNEQKATAVEQLAGAFENVKEYENGNKKIEESKRTA